MRVSVILAVGDKEVTLEGDSSLFGGSSKGSDLSLRDIGFWLDGWKYGGHGGPSHKGSVFVPWTSACYIIELK